MILILSAKFITSYVIILFDCVFFYEYNYESVRIGKGYPSLIIKALLKKFSET